MTAALSTYIAADLFGFIIAMALLAIVALCGICGLLQIERQTRELEEQAYGDASLLGREVK